MIGVIRYFEEAQTNYRKAFKPGQLYWAPVPYVPMPRPRRLKLAEYDAAKPHLTTFELAETDLSNFRPEEDPQLRGVSLAQDEFILASVHKRRMVVLVSEPATEAQESGIPEECLLVVPLYGLKDAAGNYRSWASPTFVRKAQGYQYANMFYLPEDTAQGIEEAVLRLDRVTPMPVLHLQPKPSVLTDDATGLLREWIYHFLGAPLFNNVLEDYIRRVAAEISRGSAGTGLPQH